MTATITTLCIALGCFGLGIVTGMAIQFYIIVKDIDKLVRIMKENTE